MNWKKFATYSFIIFVIILIAASIKFHQVGLLIYGGLTEQVDYQQFRPATDPIVIKNVNVLSTNSEHFIGNKAVLIENGHIQILDSLSSHIGEVAVIDGTGKYLIPGLIDAHVHLFKSPNDLLLYIANGITEIRELIGSTDHLVWKEQIENGRIGPKMFVATPRLGTFDTIEGWFMSQTQGYMNIKNAADGVQKVKELHAAGYDGVKIYSQLNKESYLSVLKTAQSLDMPVFGHIPWNLALEDVWQNGQSGIAHFEEVMNALQREFGRLQGHQGHFGGFREHEAAFLEFVHQRSADLADNLIKNNISVTSTLWLTQSFGRQKTELDQVLTEVELDYQNPGISEWVSYIPGGLGWLPAVNRFKFERALTPEEIASRMTYWDAYSKACEILAANLSARGVKIMAGTDANLPPTVPGFSLHDELKSLNKAGMSPAQVLQAATSTPAEWLESNTGTIETGRVANLVLLDKNPLEDIANTTAINMVIAKGQVFDRDLLDQMLVAVKEANDASRTVDISQYRSKK